MHIYRLQREPSTPRNPLAAARRAEYDPAKVFAWSFLFLFWLAVAIVRGIGVKMKPDGSQVFHVAADAAGSSLAGALKQWLAGQSWSQVRRVLSGRRVQVNGNLCVDEGRRLTEGEVVKVLAHGLAPPPREDDVEIRYLDTHVVVVEKPAGITTLRHSEELNWPDRRKQQQPTLDELLPGVIARVTQGQRAAKKGQPRTAAKERVPGVRPVHRLDRDTSGLMVFARTVPAETHLVQQFRKHTIHRAYIAIVHGEVQARTIESTLARDRGDGRRGSTKLKDTGQHAVTHVRPIERLRGYTVVECRLETGRTHQIRIHLSENGHLVCGDKVYCQPLFKKPIVDRSGAPRLALHAAELGFVHPITGEQVHFKMPLPRDLTDFVDELRPILNQQYNPK